MTEDVNNNENMTKELFLKALKKKRFKFELVKDGNRVIFTKKKKTFFADLDSKEDFVIINFLHNIYINMEDEPKLSMLRKAVNATNIMCSVTTIYDKNEEDDLIFVLSKGTINFVIDNPNFEMELEMVLNDCLAAQYLMKGFMKKKNQCK